ncbi:MAG TPA: hypothetical protein VFM10_09270 [Terriglobales bacterium]|nr:hypothetical protein [Terriglobales bacterium]
MARGWESKSVEAQVEDAASAKQAERKDILSAEEADRRRQRELLAMSRRRTEQLLAAATDQRYRQLLERELLALDEKLAKVG